MPAAGYSTTPLAKKLGYKPGYIVRLVNPPENYWSLFTDLPGSMVVSDDPKQKKNGIHFFTKNAEELKEMLPQLKNELLPDGMIWVSWPKQAAKIATDVNEIRVRDLAIKNGLVDIKVCSIDELWSGLKLVIPVKDRGS